MSLYFKIGNEISSSITNFLVKIDSKVGFVAGGGFGYDSIKYKNSDVVGDYDFLCLADDEEKLYRIIFESKKYLGETGFSDIKVPIMKDLELFKEEIISF